MSTVTVTVHSSVMVSTSTHTAPPESTSIISTTNTESTGDLAPPARPTSLSTATTDNENDSSETNSICPIGFYACSAVYQGGCCRTARNCDTTSCPATVSTTVASNGRETIVAPESESDAKATATDACASGWFGCAEGDGGGCCPSGFACGSESCTASASGTATTATGTVSKEQTSGGGGRGRLASRRSVSVLAIFMWLLSCI